MEGELPDALRVQHGAQVQAQRKSYNAVGKHGQDSDDDQYLGTDPHHQEREVKIGSDGLI